MDGKPQRPFRALATQVAPLENQPPAKFPLHHRHKSAGNLKTMTMNGGLKVAPKRTPFGDVSNTAKALVDIGLQDMMIKPRIISAPTEKENLVQATDGLSRPELRPQAQGGKETAISVSSIPSNNSTKTESDSTAAAEQPPLVVKPVNPKRATVVFSDSQRPKTAVSAHVTKPASTSAYMAGAELKKPRHHKSQPLLKLEQPSLRRTQSRLLKPDDELVLGEDEVTAALYVDALEQQLQSMDAGADLYHYEPDSHEATCDDASKPDSEPQYVPTQVGKDLPPVASLLEPEECWEEEEEELYDEQGYTTAHSYRSHGDSTTGGVTTMLAPKVTAKVRKELDMARTIVEESRSPEELEEEIWDVSMVAEYGEEIFEYMRELEVKMTPNPHYMDIQTEIQWSMRAVLMDWLIQVHNRFSLLPETLFLTVNYIDRFLSVKIVSLGKLQLVGATAIFLAAKYEEINCPSIQEIVYMVDSGYSMDEILKAERFMLSMLGFELGWPGPMSFLRRISKADDYDLETRTLAKYFLEVTVMDERFVGSPPSFIAAGAHCLSRLMLKKGDWSLAHVHYSGYTFNQLKPLVSMIFDCCLSPEQHHAAVYEKYADKRYKRASQYVEDQIRLGFSLSFSHASSRLSAPRVTISDDSAPVPYPHRDFGLLIPIEG